jgi:hypothetical protein
LSAGCSTPEWYWIAPQHTWPRGITTSQSFCWRTRAVAELVSGNIASATHLRNSATRARLGPIAGSTSGSRADRPESFGGMACIRRKVGGRRRLKPDRSAQSRTPRRCKSRAGASAALTRPE